MRRFVLGDIHGRLDYLLQVIEKSGIDPEKDQLIFVGDVVDRGPDPFKCIDKLLEFKNLIPIRGNHDAAFSNYIEEGIDFLGEQNGTIETIEAWRPLSLSEKYKYTQFFENQRNYYISKDNIMFVHGGFPRDEKLDEVVDHVFYWDRELVMQAMSCKGKDRLTTLYNFKEIFIGHTPTIYWGELKPIFSGGVINVDTGSGKGGPLTIMDVDTKEYWQSDYTIKLSNYNVIQTKDKSNSREAEEEAVVEG